MVNKMRLTWNIFLRHRHLSSGIGAKFQRYLRATAYTFNVHTLCMLFVAILSVYICLELDIRWNMDFSLVSAGTVFPLTFTISQAYARRERATVLIANLKASVVATYFMHRDWAKCMQQHWIQDQSENYPSSLGNDRNAWALKTKVLLVELLVALKNFLTLRSELYESIAEKRLTAVENDLQGLFEHHVLLSENDRAFAKSFHKLQRHDPGRPYLADCYRAVSMLSVMNEQLTMRAGFTRGGEGGMSRTNQYLRYIVSNIEELRMIKEYRTPAMMRHACSVLFHIFCVILAPYFSHYCDTWLSQGHEEGLCAAGYMGATMYVLIVMLLLHCAQDLEDCFDETGLDDVFFTTHAEVDDLSGNDKVLGVDQNSGNTSRAESLAGHSPGGSFRLQHPTHILPDHMAGMRRTSSDVRGASPTGRVSGGPSLSALLSHEKLVELAPARPSSDGMHTIPSGASLHLEEEATQQLPAARSTVWAPGEVAFKRE